MPIGQLSNWYPRNFLHWLSLTIINLIIFISIQVAVNALLGDTPTLVEYGTALMSNLATKEVKAVVR